jgi:thiamine phosphate synthase YjbQ (UPF0047 family)
METLSPGSTYCHSTIRITTHHPTEFVDLTSRLAALVADAEIHTGFVSVQSLHTTTGIVVNEHEPLLLADFANCLEAIAPRGARYQHDSPHRNRNPQRAAKADDPAVRHVDRSADERVNGHAHCRALLLPSCACLNVVDGQLLLGRWQRVFLAELDGPRERQISVVLGGSVR